MFSAHTEGSCPSLLGELEAFHWIVDIRAQILSEGTTEPFLKDEHEIPGCVLCCHVVAGDEGRQEGEERDLGEHVFGVDSAKFLWIAMGNHRLERTVRTKRGPWDCLEEIDGCSKHG